MVAHTPIPFSTKDKKPVKEGTRVLVPVHWAGTVHEGTVQAVLDTQFTYVEDETGQVFFCPYDGDWKHNDPR